jgi:hypothetical protein
MMEHIRNKMKEPEAVATVAMGIVLLLAVTTVGYSLWQAFNKAGMVG